MATKKTTTKEESKKTSKAKPQIQNPHIGLVQNDSWLEPFEDAIRGRHDHALWKLNQLTKNGKQKLTDFASGHFYFGLHKLARGWVFREWAPNATDIYLIGDFNDNKESAELVQSLMSLASQKGICIWLALHLNPRPGNDDESKMRGHLGTELGNKVTDTLVSIKKKDATGVTFTVKQQDARGKDMDDWKFQVTDDAGNLGIPKIIGSGIDLPVREKVKADTTEDIRQWIKDASDMYDWPMSRKDIKEKVFKEIGKQKNKDMQAADLQVAMNMKYLTESTLKANGYYMLEPSDEIKDMPF